MGEGRPVIDDEHALAGNSAQEKVRAVSLYLWRLAPTQSSARLRIRSEAIWGTPARNREIGAGSRFQF
jgi:hypothetical protein